jgi:hypothetical protein
MERNYFGLLLLPLIFVGFSSQAARHPYQHHRHHINSAYDEDSGDSDGKTFMLTGYSAACGNDPQGGPNKSSWGNLRPRSHTLDGKPELETVEVAATVSGGSAGLWGCFIEFDFSHSTVPPRIQKLFEGKRIFAADHYSPKYHNRKFDVSLECTSRKNLNSFTYYGVVARKVKCLGTSRQAQARGLPPVEKNLAELQDEGESQAN